MVKNLVFVNKKMLIKRTSHRRQNLFEFYTTAEQRETCDPLTKLHFTLIVLHVPLLHLQEQATATAIYSQGRPGLVVTILTPVNTSIGLF